MNAIILAGGKNSRMEGNDKAFLRINGIPLVRVILKTLNRVVKDVIIVTNSLGRYGQIKAEIVEDIFPGKGPLSGIHAGLTYSSSIYNLVVACDMPFIEEGLIKYLSKLAPGYEIVVPRIKGRFEPLLAVYSRRVLPYIEEALESNKLAIKTLFKKLKIRVVEEKEITKFDPALHSFYNINTPAELKYAER